MNATAKIIHLNNGATINAQGNHVRSNVKPVFCVETGEVFTSVSDAAQCAKVSISAMSHTLRKHGVCKGKHYRFLSERDDSLDAMTAHIRYMSATIAEMEAKLSTLSDKASAYDNILKAEAEKQTKIDKINTAIKRTCERIELHHKRLESEQAIIATLTEELQTLEAEKSFIH